MLEIRNINKRFRTKEQNVHACNDVSLTVNDGDIFGVMGYSGAGKSTLVRCINFLEIPDSGEVEISGFGTVISRNGKLFHRDESGREVVCSEKNLRELRRGVGMIFQSYNLLDRSTVYDNIAYSLKYSGISKEEIDKRVRELLDIVDLKDKIASYPAELSGGQKQRVAIARALANNPRILLSDEATSALDPDATESILNLLKKLNRELGLTIVLITHEMAVIKSIATKVAVMENGKVVEQGDVYDIFAHPEQPITRNFVGSSMGMGNINRLLEENETILSSSRNGRLVRLVFERDSVGEALISNISRDYHVNLNIILADVELIQGEALGNMIVILDGEKEDVEKAMNRFAECNVRVEEVAA